jgi:hypothetical protein
MAPPWPMQLAVPMGRILVSAGRIELDELCQVAPFPGEWCRLGPLSSASRLSGDLKSI